MTTIGSLAAAVLILGLQLLFARWLDRTLPKRKTLPLWMRGGPSLESRWWALHAHIVLSAVIGVCLIGAAIAQDLDARPIRTNLRMIAASSFLMIVFGLLQLLNGWRIKRWFRQGRPPLY